MVVFGDIRSFEDQAAAGAWLGEAFGGWADGLSDGEHRALAEYKTEGYRPLNAALRQGPPLSDEHARTVGLLDRALERSSLAEPVVVYRGFHLAGAAIVGARIEDRAYFSASLLAGHAEGFLNVPAEQPFSPALARVLLPAGTPAGRRT